MLSLTSRQGPRPASQNCKLLMFGSNDYLSLAGGEDVVQAGVAAMLRFGTGVAMNQPFATTPLHDELRQRIAAFTGTEAALLFGSCTAANIALLTTLARESDAVILSDANNHASIIDGCRLARGRSLVYRTRDIVDLARQLDRLAPGLAVTVVSDGVFSVEGGHRPRGRTRTVSPKSRGCPGAGRVARGRRDRPGDGVSDRAAGRCPPAPATLRGALRCGYRPSLRCHGGGSADPGSDRLNRVRRSDHKHKPSNANPLMSHAGIRSGSTCYGYSPGPCGYWWSPYAAPAWFSRMTST